MRDLASCLSDHAVQVSGTSCSSYKNVNPCISIPSIQNSVTCLYKTTLSNQKQLTTTVTWSRTTASHSLTLLFNDDPSAAFKISTNSRLFRKSKGSKSLQTTSSKIELFYDLSTARYQPGPEPAGGFYVAVVACGELALILGDKDYHEFANKKARIGKFALVSRQEHFSGSTVYSTKARFCDGGGAHDISIRCGGVGLGGEGELGARYPILSVCIDKKTVIRVKKLQWNFRGNQTIFLDGLLVDLMWDVHGWFYNPDSGYAVFMFKTRSGLDSRLWLQQEEEKVMRCDDDEDDDRLDFSFMICACKNV